MMILVGRFWGGGGDRKKVNAQVGLENDDYSGRPLRQQSNRKFKVKITIFKDGNNIRVERNKQLKKRNISKLVSGD